MHPKLRVEPGPAGFLTKASISRKPESVDEMLLEILVAWVIGIPALAIGGAVVLAVRRERWLRYQRSLRRARHAGPRGGVGFVRAARPAARNHLRSPAA